jgi:hypothetical protein
MCQIVANSVDVHEFLPGGNRAPCNSAANSVCAGCALSRDHFVPADAAASSATASSSPTQDIKEPSVKNMMLCDELNPDLCPLSDRR